MLERSSGGCYNGLMKKILAIITVALLVLLYLLTLISAIINTPFTNDLFRASVAATILLPITFFVIVWIRNVLRMYRPVQDSEPESSEKDSEITEDGH